MFTLLIDMDGVLTRDKEFNPIEGAVDFINRIRELGIPFRIVSNNSTRHPSLIVEKLREKGFDLEVGDFISPVVILPSYLRERGVGKVFVIGTPLLSDFLREEGFEVHADHRVEAVVVGQDKELNFKKLKTAVSAVFLEGAIIVPVNRTAIVRDSDSLYFPGAGSIAQMIAHATRYDKELPNLGKPSPDFIKLALEGLPSEEVYLVSDDIYTDLMGASEAGLKTVFMTTGKYGADEPAKAGFEPDLTMNSLRELENKIMEWLKR